MATVQITVRLPDDLVAEMDAAVADGTAKSRAAVVARALRRDMRQRLYEEEALRLAALPPLTADGQAEEESLARWATENVAKVMAELD
jgi:Arc/MetJ-type ribon-helix-helix transcriptional regulator